VLYIIISAVTVVEYQIKPEGRRKRRVAGLQGKYNNTKKSHWNKMKMASKMATILNYCSLQGV